MHACNAVRLQVRHVALRLCAQAKTVDEVVRAIVAMLRRHNVPRAHFAAHSFGTFVVAHLRHLYPSTVFTLLLCDPVRFATVTTACMTIAVMSSRHGPSSTLGT